MKAEVASLRDSGGGWGGHGWLLGQVLWCCNNNLGRAESVLLGWVRVTEFGKYGAYHPQRYGRGTLVSGIGFVGERHWLHGRAAVASWVSGIGFVG